MPIVKADIDAEAYERLIDQASAERRPIPLQAGVAIRRALGLPFPPDETAPARERDAVAR